MPDEFELQGKVSLDTSALKSLPEQAAQVAQTTQGRLAAIANYQPPYPGSVGFRRTAEEQVRYVQVGQIGMTKQWEKAAELRENIAKKSGDKQVSLQERINQRLIDLENQRIAEVDKAEEKHGRPTDRPAAVGGRSSSAAAGFFRGFAQQVAAGTGIGVPFLSLSPVFIAASVAASAFTLSIKEAFAASDKLSNSIQQLRVVAGGDLLGASRISAQARTFGVANDDLISGMSNLQKKIQENDPVFNRLGISIQNTNGPLVTAADVWPQVRDAISQIKDPTLQASVAFDVFGSSYTKLLPVLQATPQVMQQNAAAIEKVAKAGENVAEKQSDAQRRAQRGGEAWAGFWASAGAKMQEGIGFIADEILKAQEGQKAFDEAIRSGKSDEEARTAAAAARLRVEQQLANIPTTAGPMPLESVDTLKAIASAAADARQQSDSLNQSLLAVGQQRLQIAFQIQTAELSIQDMIYDQQISLANEAEDHANRLRLQTAALTISLNEFRAAEQSAAIRAREQEKSFFAFRPDNALQRQIEEQTYQRNRAQEIARDQRLVERAQRQLDNQKQVSALEEENLTRQENIITQQLALFNLLHPDVVTNSETALNQLRAAILEQSGGTVDINMLLTVDSRDFTEAENAQIRAAILKAFGGAVGGAIPIIRAQSARAARPGRIGGSME